MDFVTGTAFCRNGIFTTALKSKIKLPLTRVTTNKQGYLPQKAPTKISKAYLRVSRTKMVQKLHNAYSGVMKTTCIVMNNQINLM